MYDHLLNEIDKLLWTQFPNESAASDSIFWQLEPTRTTWFQLAIRATGIIDSSALSKHIREVWFPQRKHSLRKSHRLNLEKLVEAWHEWQFAVTKLARSPEASSGIVISEVTEKLPSIRVYQQEQRTPDTSSLANELRATQAENARLKILLAETILDQARTKNPITRSS